MEVLVSGAEIQTSAVDPRATLVWVSTAEKSVLRETRTFFSKFAGKSKPRTSRNLGDLLLLLTELQFDQELQERVVDTINFEVRVSKLMLGVEHIPYVANGSTVLCDAIHGLYDERNNSSRMDILSGLDAQFQTMLRLFEPFGYLVKGRRCQLWRGQDLLLHGYLIDIWKEDKLLHDMPDYELSCALSTSHTGICHSLWNHI